jgi:hypothetical protein
MGLEDPGFEVEGIFVRAESFFWEFMDGAS